MRVIAGRLGGRRFRAPPGRRTRPTAERTREALFSMLGDIAGKKVIDLYAGSGALGIEALSRGAAHAVFVERDPPAARVLRANLEALALGPEEAEVRTDEAIRALGRASERRETYDLVFIDPPYSQAAALGGELTGALQAVLAPGALVVGESDRRAPLQLDLATERARRYGDTLITIHSHR